jgi:hypothetical protein
MEIPMPRRRNPTTRSCAGAAAALFFMMASAANAGAIYRCAGADGALAFQATPCASGTAQTTVTIRQQPLIGTEVPAPVRSVRPAHGKSAARRSREGLRARGASRRRLPPQATSWECRAADGEVFYRHSRCPHSVPGDGVMRSGRVYAIGRGKASGRSRARTAWSPVPVHARKVPRSEACRQINAVAAVERDGSARDTHVSVYEHDRGRDPCAGY